MKNESLSTEKIVNKVLSNALSHQVSQISFKAVDELYADLAIDSRRFIRLIQELETYLGYEINDEDLLEADLITVGDLTKFINSLRSRVK